MRSRLVARCDPSSTSRISGGTTRPPLLVVYAHTTKPHSVDDMLLIFLILISFTKPKESIDNEKVEAETKEKKSEIKNDDDEQESYEDESIKCESKEIELLSKRLRQLRGQLAAGKKEASDSGELTFSALSVNNDDTNAAFGASVATVDSHSESESDTTKSSSGDVDSSSASSLSVERPSVMIKKRPSSLAKKQPAISNISIESLELKAKRLIDRRLVGMALIEDCLLSFLQLISHYVIVAI